MMVQFEQFVPSENIKQKYVNPSICSSTLFIHYSHV